MRKINTKDEDHLRAMWVLLAIIAPTTACLLLLMRT